MSRMPQKTPMKKASGHREIQPPFGASRHNSITPSTSGTK